MEHSSIPLFVDLDGTVIISDITIETLFALLKKKPWMIAVLPFWNHKGRAYLKRQIAERVKIDPAILPYNDAMMTYVKSERGKRDIILATASDEKYARVISDYLGCFTGILGSDGITNAKGKQKVQKIHERTGGGPFAYAGNSAADLPIFKVAKESIVVNASPRTIRKAKTFGNPKIIGVKQNEFFALLQGMRIHHWVKNALVFVPLFTAHVLTESPLIFAALLGAAAFSVTASSVYLTNDISDIDADRQHPWKNRRPIASGKLSIQIAIVGIVILLLAGEIVALLLPKEFIWTLWTYFITTILYSFWLKKLFILDTVTLAVLYTLRIIGGTTATGVAYSGWLITFSMFLFFSLALMKRYSELRGFGDNLKAPLHGRKYIASDRNVLLPIGIISSYLSILIFALYINSNQVRSLYLHPLYLWLICPLLLAFVTRLWLIAYLGKMNRDPVTYVLSDFISLALIALSTSVVFMAT